jgi:hypothetical protein
MAGYARPSDSHGAFGELVELGGAAAAQIAEPSVSIELARGATWQAAPSSDQPLLSVEEGFVLVCADIRNGCGGEEDLCGDGQRGEGSRRIVIATGESGTFLVPPALDERLEALTPCRLTLIPADLLRALLALPEVAAAISDALAEALRERQATIRNCAYVRHSERVRGKLLQLARMYGHVVPGGVRIDFPLTNQLLADMVGSARETVSIALATFVREGFVHRDQRSYVLRIDAQDLGPVDVPAESRRLVHA